MRVSYQTRASAGVKVRWFQTKKTKAKVFAPVLQSGDGGQRAWQHEVMVSTHRAFKGLGGRVQEGPNIHLPKKGYLFRGPNNKDYSILGSILGSPYLGKLPYTLTKKGLPYFWKPIGVSLASVLSHVCKPHKSYNRCLIPTLSLNIILIEPLFNPSAIPTINKSVYGRIYTRLSYSP